jgi:hypothetical protein
MTIMDTEMRRPALSPEALQEMNRYGIVRVPADSFHYREFRYTNLNDALAQARRDVDRGQRTGPQAASRHPS